MKAFLETKLGLVVDGGWQRNSVLARGSSVLPFAARACGTADPKNR